MQQPQPFEKFKELTHYIQHMASTGMVPNGSGWTSFLYELNKVCSAVPEDLSAPASPVEESAQDGLKWNEIKAIKCVHCGEINQPYKNGNDKVRCWFCKELLSDGERVVLKLTHSWIESKPSPVIEIGGTPKPEDMPQTENPLASYWFEKARLCLVERNDFKAQLARANEKIVEMAKASHPAPAPIVDARDAEIQAYRQAFVDILRRANWMSDETQIARDILSKYPQPAPIVGEREEEDPAVKSQKYIPNPNNGTEAHPCAEYAAGLRELLREAHTQLAAANALIKEKQEWINSHI